jgi:hypothetical protein
MPVLIIASHDPASSLAILDLSGAFDAKVFVRLLSVVFVIH